MRYDYKCAACGHEEEHVHPMVDDALTDCPACGVDSYYKVLYPTKTLFIGDGWDANNKDGRYHIKGGT